MTLRPGGGRGKKSVTISKKYSSEELEGRESGVSDEDDLELLEKNTILSPKLNWTHKG